MCACLRSLLQAVAVQDLCIWDLLLEVAIRDERIIALEEVNADSDNLINQLQTTNQQLSGDLEAKKVRRPGQPLPGAPQHAAGRALPGMLFCAACCAVLMRCICCVRADGVYRRRREAAAPAPGDDPPGSRQELPAGPADTGGCEASACCLIASCSVWVGVPLACVHCVGSCSAGRQAGGLCTGKCRTSVCGLVV